MGGDPWVDRTPASSWRREGVCEVLIVVATPAR